VSQPMEREVRDLLANPPKQPVIVLGSCARSVGVGKQELHLGAGSPRRVQMPSGPDDLALIRQNSEAEKATPRWRSRLFS